MPTPSIQTLRNDAQQVLNLDSISAVRSVVAATLANANAGTPLNPNLTTQQLWNEFYQIVTQPKSDIESIIANQLMKFLYAPPAPGGAGADKQVIFNDGGVLAGDPQFLWNKTTNLLTVTGSATITGDLTVDTSTLKVDSANDRVGIQSTILNSRLTVRAGTLAGIDIYRDDANANFSGIRFKGTTNSTVNAQIGWSGTQLRVEGTDEFLCVTNSSDRFRISSSGVFTFENVGGVAGTAMTLNANGLGVGASPSYKFHVGGYSSSNIAPDAAIVRSSSGTTIQSGPSLLFSDGVSNNSICLQNSQGRFGIWNYGAGAWNERLSVDANGNCGIGVTPNPAWNVGSGKTIQLTANASLSGGLTNSTYLAQNWYYDNVNSRYLVPGYCLVYEQNKSNGSHVWYNTTLGAASGDIATIIPAMTLDINGNLILRSSATPATLGTNGQLTVNATSNTNLRFSYRGSDGVTRVANITLA